MFATVEQVDDFTLLGCQCLVQGLEWLFSRWWGYW